MDEINSILRHRDEVMRLAKEHGASRVRVFGSVARGQETSTSDVDVLVALEPGRSLLDLVSLRNALEELLGCRVDVVTEGGLSPHLADTILREAVPL